MKGTGNKHHFRVKLKFGGNGFEVPPVVGRGSETRGVCGGGGGLMQERETLFGPMS